MIILNGGSYYPESEAIDRYWISRIEKNAPIAFIPSAAVNSQESYFEFFHANMQKYGLSNLISVDLYSDWSDIKKAEVIYIGGGNTYKLIDIMRKSGFGEYLKKERDSHIIIGNSAGAVVLGRDIRSSNDADIIGIGDTGGLDLVDFSICPHYTGRQKPRLEKLADVLGHRIAGVPETSAIIIDDGISTIGPVYYFPETSE